MIGRVIIFGLISLRNARTLVCMEDESVAAVVCLKNEFNEALTLHLMLSSTD